MIPKSSAVVYTGNIYNQWFALLMSDWADSFPQNSNQTIEQTIDQAYLNF